MEDIDEQDEEANDRRKEKKKKDNGAGPSRSISFDSTLPSSHSVGTWHIHVVFTIVLCILNSIQERARTCNFKIYTEPQNKHYTFNNSIRYGKQSIYFSLNYKFLL